MDKNTRDLFELIETLTHCFEDLVQLGKQLGSVRKNGQSFWGILRILNERGPMTVPQLANARNLSRQRVQVIVDEYVEEGLLELALNPKHKRSKLVTLSSKGKVIYIEHSKVMEQELSKLTQAFGDDELGAAKDTLEKLKTSLKTSRKTRGQN